MANMVTYPLNKIEYQATDAELFHCTRNSGVYSGDDFSMSVTGANNIVTFAPGIAWIRNGRFTGKVIASKENVSLDFGVADSALPRWDIACIQFNKNNNATDIVVKKGTAASSPVLPAITQAETLYELCLCKVYRPAGSVAITADNVYDTRLDEAVCGLMADSVTSVDTSAIKAQIDALIANAINATEGDKGINQYNHTKTGTVHSLTGIGANIKFVPQADWVSGDTLEINGYPAYPYNQLAENISGEVIFKKHTVVFCFAEFVTDRYNCFFKLGGGGLSDAELRKATAATADVLSGKTFYSGNKTLKTGTMPDKSGKTQLATPTLDNANNRLQMNVPATGKYSTASKVYATYSTIRSLIGLTAEKIVNNNTILGITGTAKTIAGNLWIGSGTTTAQGENGVTVKCEEQGTYTNAFQAKPIDLTNVNSITFHVTAVSGTIGASYYSLVAVRNTQGYNTAGYGNYKIVTGAGDYTVDVSGLSGLYVPVVQAGYMNGASVTISGYSIN